MTAAPRCRFTKEMKKKPKLDEYSSDGKLFRAMLADAALLFALRSTLIHHDHCSIPAEAGLKYYDLQPGNGDEIVKGKVVKVGVL